MKKLNVVFFCLFVMTVAVGCVTTSGPVKVEERQTAVATGDGKSLQILTCNLNSGIKITLGEVTCKASGCKSNGASQSGGGLFALMQFAGVPNFEGIGQGLQDMFTGSLREVGCFKVLDREAMESIRKEMALAGREVKMESADYIVMGSITSVNFEKSSGSIGYGLIPVVGAISSSKQTATLGMDVRLVNVNTGEVAFSKTYTAASGKTSYGIGGFGAARGVGFGGALSSLSGTAMEEVSRDVIVKATYDIAKFLAPGQVNIQTIPSDKGDKTVEAVEQ